MNILFFLKPKSEVAYVHDYGTLRQVLETMEYHKYASIPMLNKSGEYVGTITEGDLLWGIKRYTNLNLKEAENIFIQDFPRKVDYVAVSINSDMEDLLQKAMNQNFVPVVDDQKKFIGIVTRKSIMEYCYEKLKNLVDCKTNLNYKKFRLVFLCNLYKMEKKRERCKRMNDNAFLKSRRTGIFKDMSNGTICIPKDLRDNNGLEKNDRVELIPMQEGIYIRKAYGEKKCQ